MNFETMLLNIIFIEYTFNKYGYICRLKLSVSKTLKLNTLINSSLELY